MNSLKVGTKSKKSCRMNRAVSLIAAGQGLDLGLVPAAPLLCLLRDDQAGAAQLGQIGRVALGVAGDERAHVGNRDVVAEDAGDGVDEGDLPFAPVP